MRFDYRHGRGGTPTRRAASPDASAPGGAATKYPGGQEAAVLALMDMAQATIRAGRLITGPGRETAQRAIDRVITIMATHKAPGQELQAIADSISRETWPADLEPYRANMIAQMRAGLVGWTRAIAITTQRLLAQQPGPGASL